MYADFFGFRELPFNNTPDPRFFYSTPDHEEALASLVYAVKERKGFVLLTGEVGTGKTLVTRMLLRRVDTKLAFANLNHSVQSPTELMESICTEFDLQFTPGASQTHLVRVLHDFLLAQFAQDVTVVLVLDEAQNLPIDGFEQLRMIGNLEADDAKLLQVAIVGQPELQRMFVSPKMRQLRQRIFRSFHLSALNRRMTEEYIKHRLSVVTDTYSDLFDTTAIDAIYSASTGLPRLINTLCDNALLSAYSDGRRTIDGSFVDTMISQMLVVGATAPDEITAPVSSPTPSTYAAGSARAATSRLGEETPSRRGTAPAGRNSRMERRRQDNATYGEVVQLVHAERAALEHDIGARSAELEVRLRRMERRFGGGAHDNSARGGNLEARLARMERRFGNGGSELTEARTVQARLEPLVQRTGSLIGRAEAATRILAQREAKQQRLIVSVRDILRELRGLLERARKTTAESKEAQRNARTTCDRLAAQSEQSLRLADEFARTMNRAELPESLKHASAETVGSRVSASADRGVGESKLEQTAWKERLPVLPPREQAGKVQQLLDGARESLTDLRSLAQASRSPAGTSDSAMQNEPVARLAGQVEDLLEMVEPASGAASGSPPAAPGATKVPVG